MKYEPEITLGNLRTLHQIAVLIFSELFLVKSWKKSTKQTLGKRNQKATMTCYWFLKVPCGNDMPEDFCGDLTMKLAFFMLSCERGDIE